MPTAPDEIATDLAESCELLQVSADTSPSDPLNVATHVAATAIERTMGGQPSALKDNAGFAVETVLSAASAFIEGPDLSEENQHFDLAADRPAARVLSCLLLPQLREALSETDYTSADVDKAARAVAVRSSPETRRFLARGTDHVWSAPCVGDPCVHVVALDWIRESLRSAEIGDWDSDGMTRHRAVIERDPVDRLAELEGEAIDFDDLEAAIRGFGAAGAVDSCVSDRARDDLYRLIRSQRASMIHYGSDFPVDDRGAGALVTARAFLQNAHDGAQCEITEHLDGIGRDAHLLSNFLHGLAAAGTETPALARAAREMWPIAIQHCIRRAGTADDPYTDRHWGDWAVSALLPRPLDWVDPLYTEAGPEPIDWVIHQDLVPYVDAWVELARGNVRCVRTLILFMAGLDTHQTVELGLVWVGRICDDGGVSEVHKSAEVGDWLVKIRASSESMGLQKTWQDLVDLLVARGNRQLAPYSVQTGADVVAGRAAGP